MRIEYFSQSCPDFVVCWREREKYSLSVFITVGDRLISLKISGGTVSLPLVKGILQNLTSQYIFCW